MGLILNPIAFRIGHTISWSDGWYMHRLYYPVFLHSVLLIKALIFYILFRYFPRRRSKWLYSHTQFFIYNNKIFLNVFLYNSRHDSWTIHEYEKQFKFKRFSKLRLKSFWVKKKLLDWNEIGQLLFVVFQFFRLPIDWMNFDLLEAKYSFKKVRHLMNLKKRNSRRSGPVFVTHEELDMLSGMLKTFKRRRKKKRSSKYMKIKKNEKNGVVYFLNKPKSKFRRRGKKRYPLSFFLKIKKKWFFFLKRAKILFISDLNKYNLFKEKNEIEIKKLKSFKIFLYFLKKYKSLLRLLLIIRIFKIKRVNYLKVLKEKMSILKASDINLFLFLIVRYMTVKVKLDRVYWLRNENKKKNFVKKLLIHSQSISKKKNWFSIFLQSFKELKKKKRIKKRRLRRFLNKNRRKKMKFFLRRNRKIFWKFGKKKKRDWEIWREKAHNYSLLGIPFILSYLKRFYSDMFKFKNIDYKKLPIYKKGISLKWRQLKYNYVFLFYVLNFFDYMFFKNKLSYPPSRLNRFSFFSFYQFYFFWFKYRNLSLRLKKLVELLLLKFGFNVHVKLFIIDNASVSANFMAKYLAHSFRLGFNFFDIIVPLKKNLGKLMSVRLLKSWKGRATANEKMIEHIESEREVVFNYFKNYLMFIFSKILVNLSDLRSRFFFIYQKKIFKFMKKRVKFPLFLNFNKFKILKVIYEKFVFRFFSFRKLLKKNNLKKMKIKNFIFCELKLKILYVDYFFIKIYMFYLYFIFLIKNKIVKERFCLLNYFCKFLNKFLLKNKIRFVKNRLFFFNINYNSIFEISNNFLIFYNEFIYKNLERKFNLCIFDIVIKINFVCGFIFKKKINFLNKQIFNIKINFISLNKIYYLFFFKRFFERIYFIKKSFKERGIRSFYKKKGRFKQLFLHYIIKKSFSFKKVRSIFWKYNLNFDELKILKKLKNKLNLYFFFVNLKLKKKLNNKAYFLKNLNKKLRLSNKFLKVLKTDKEIIKFLKNLTIDYIEKLKYDVICFSLLKNIFFKLKDKRFKHFFLSFTFDSINKIYDIKKLKINYYKKINNNLKNFSKKNVKFDIDFIFIFILFKYYYLKSKYLKKKKINRLRKNLWFFLQNFYYLYSFKQNFFYDLEYDSIFPYDLNNLLKYLQQIKKFDLFYEKKLNILEKSKIEELENLEVIPLKYKLKKLKYLMKNSVLNGYKFQFKGRFTRKQKAANMWFSKGALPMSTKSQIVDYGFSTFVLDYSACTVKIWLYKGVNAPKYIYRVT